MPSCCCCCGSSKTNAKVAAACRAPDDKGGNKNKQQPAPAQVIMVGKASASSKEPAPAQVSMGGSQRKLNVLCLHGTTMNGKSMAWMTREVKDACVEVATFHYPTGPHVVSKNHKIYQMAPEAKKGDLSQKFHWWKMKDSWDFSEPKFKDAKKALMKFAEENINGPVDVILGFSQGAAACTQILNEIAKGSLKHKQFSNIKGAVYYGCPGVPKISKDVPTSLLHLHINAEDDKLTSIKGAREHAKMCEKDTFVAPKTGGHTIDKNYVEPTSRFLLAVQKFGGLAPSATE